MSFCVRVSHILHFVEPSHHRSNRIPFNRAKIRTRGAGSHSGSVRFSGNGNRVPLGRRFLAESAKTDAQTNHSTQIPKLVEEEEANSSQDVGSPSRSFLSLLCPLLRFLGGGDPSQQRNEFLEVVTSTVSSLARLPWGSTSLLEHSLIKENKENPPLHLQLYEFEACPFCRRVREAMTELDLTVEVYPCPKGSLRHRKMVRELGGKDQFPFLVDPNTGVSMYESGDIVRYLFQHYGQGRNPSPGLLESTLFTGWMPTLLRVGRGMTLWDRAQLDPPSKKLELFSYENNQYARIVREALCELELPYIVHNVGKGSSKLEMLAQISSSKEVPYFVDPNTGVKMGDYKKILSYLFQTYSIAS